MNETPASGKLLKNIGCAAIVAPILAPIIFTYYIGYKTTKFAFRKPLKVLACMGLAATAWYVGCHEPRIARSALHEVEQLKYFVQQSIDRINDKRVAKLEEQVEAAHQAMLQTQPLPTPIPRATPTATPPQTPPIQTYAISEAVTATPVKAENPPKSRIAMRSDPTFNFYYVRQGETLTEISTKVFGDRNLYAVLQDDNDIDRPRALLTGELLLVRKTLCHRRVEGLYTRVPALQSIVIDGTHRISDVFPHHYTQVLELNAELGLHYSDTFAYPHGSRVVYYNGE